MTNLPVHEVAVIDDRPYNISLAIADFFGKMHKNVVRDARALMNDFPQDFTRLNFELSSC